MQVKLKVLSGSHEGKEISISTEKFLIGRSESCQLRPKSESVSRKHCIIVLREGRVLIQDLKSRNGTFVNEERLPSDRAKSLSPGDHLRIGKLSFELVIDNVESDPRPPAEDVEEAAARVAEAGINDSRVEAVDVSAWLDEADQIDRVRKLSDPETRQFRMDEGQPEPTVEGPDSGELSVDEETPDDDEKSSAGRKKKKKPGKLPKDFRKSTTESSRDAADDALKRFFSGR